MLGVSRPGGKDIARKSIALPFRISNSGFRIFRFFFQSAFRNPDGRGGSRRMEIIPEAQNRSFFCLGWSNLDAGKALFWELNCYEGRLDRLDGPNPF
jgi:hypothetical protein